MKGILLAAFFHGVYDSCLFLTKVLPGDISGLLLVSGALASLITAAVLSSRLIRLHRKTSHQYHHGVPAPSTRNASFADIPLIRSLAQQIWPGTYSSILTTNQIDYMMNLMYSERRLREQMQNGHQFIVVYNAGLPVGFAAFSLVEPTVFKLHKIYIVHS